MLLANPKALWIHGHKTGSLYVIQHHLSQKLCPLRLGNQRQLQHLEEQAILQTQQVIPLPRTHHH